MKNEKIKIVWQGPTYRDRRAFAGFGFNTEGDNNDKSKTRGKFA